MRGRPKHIPETVALGRLNDLRQSPEAERIALFPLEWDYRVKVYPSRESLKVFLGKQTGAFGVKCWHALIKDVVSPSMLVCRYYQKEG